MLVKAKFVKENDPGVWKLVTEKDPEFPENGYLIVLVELKSLTKVEDWFKDGGSGLKRILKKGKGSHPNIDSAIKIFMKISVNGNTVLNNFPEGEEESKSPLAFWNSLSDDDKKTLFDREGLFEFGLDSYQLPSPLIKVLKSMKKLELCEFETTNIEKLRTNFPNKYFNQLELFKDGDKVIITLGLVWMGHDVYFY